MNINEATLFPELEHQLIYLQHRKLPDPGAVESYERFEENVSVGSSENTERENISIVNEEPHPDVDNIVNRHLSEYPEMADAVIASVKDTISAIDWWKKESAISRIVRDVTRILQSEMSVQKSKALANSIVKELIL